MVMAGRKEEYSLCEENYTGRVPIEKRAPPEEVYFLLKIGWTGRGAASVHDWRVCGTGREQWRRRALVVNWRITISSDDLHPSLYQKAAWRHGF